MNINLMFACVVKYLKMVVMAAMVSLVLVQSAVLVFSQQRSNFQAGCGLSKQITIMPWSAPEPIVTGGGTSCTSVILDGGFETGGIPSTFWHPETSTLFCTPVCSTSQCGAGGGVAGPFAGTFWVWFGDVGPAENATIGQTVTIASGSTATLTFQLYIGRVASPFTDVMNVKIDGVTHTIYSEPAVAETGYSLRTIDLSAFADGAAHQILFEYIHPPSNGASFSLDSVALNVCPASKTEKPFDYDGDGSADLSVFRPADGNWWITLPGGGYRQQQWGNAPDRIAPADYDGDGKTDIAVYRPSEGNWYVLSSLTGTFSIQQWGDANDVIVPGDYTGDGKADHAVWRPSDGNWYVRDISNGQFTITQWGNSTDKPVPADYDGNGTFDIMAFRPSEGNWFLRLPGGGFTVTQWGDANDKLVPADYNGDGSADIAVWRPTEGNWFIRLPGGGFDVVQWGASTDIVVPADYDGNGETNIAVWRPSDGMWYILNDTGGGFTSTQWGSLGDRPTPNAYVR